MCDMDILNVFMNLYFRFMTNGLRFNADNVLDALRKGLFES